MKVKAFFSVRLYYKSSINIQFLITKIMKKSHVACIAIDIIIAECPDK